MEPGHCHSHSAASSKGHGHSHSYYQGPEAAELKQQILTSHKHGPACGHPAIHHITEDGDSHLAFINPDAAVECFAVEPAASGCCNMSLVKVAETSSCSLAALFGIDEPHPESREVVGVRHCVNHSNEHQVVAEGNGLQVLRNQETGDLIIHKFNCLVSQASTGLVSVCQVLGKLLHDNLNSFAVCDNRKADGGKYSNVKLGSQIVPSLCTGMWKMLLHSSGCENNASHTVVPCKTEALGTKGLSDRYVKSELHVGQMCCTNEVSIIERLLNYEDGVHSVRANVVMRKVTVHHDPTIIPCSRLVDILNVQSMDAKTLKDGNSGKSPEADQSLGKSYYGRKYPHWNVSLATILLLASLLQYVPRPVWMYNFKYVAIGSISLVFPDIAFRSFERLRRGLLDVTTLMTLACVGGIALGEYSEAAAVVTLYALSDWLEATATKRVRVAVDSLIALSPETAVLADESRLGPAGAHIRVEDIPIGSKLVVRDGEKFPIDGTIVSGETFADESALTGESRPVKKSHGDTVSAGTLNVGGGYVEILTKSLSKDSVVSRMAKLVEEADANRSPTEQFVETVARIYTPVIFSLAVFMATVPWAVDKETGRKYFQFSLVLLVIGCPCALVISTPITYVCGLAQAAKNGILVKGGRHLEALGSLRSLAVDKTGTLTRGQFKLKQMVLNKSTNLLTHSDINDLIYVMEKGSTHPLAIALCEAVEANGLANVSQYELLSLVNTQGEGLTARIQKKMETRTWLLNIDSMEVTEPLELLRKVDGVQYVEENLEAKSVLVVCRNCVSMEAITVPFSAEGINVVATAVGKCQDGCCANNMLHQSGDVSCESGGCTMNMSLTPESQLPNDKSCESGCCTAKMHETLKPESQPSTEKSDYCVTETNEFFIGNLSMATKLGWTRSNPEFLAKCNIWESQGFSYCIFGNRNKPIAALCVGDEIKNEAAEVVEKLRNLGIEITMLTGDNAGSAQYVSKTIGINQYHANLRPENKQEQLARLSKPVGMVGDGINDALSFASADVSIAMGVIGSAIAIETADVALMEDNLLNLEKAIRLGRLCLRKIRQNIFFSVVIKVVVVLVTLIVPFPNLWLAISADVGAMLLVTLNSMSILGK